MRRGRLLAGGLLMALATGASAAPGANMLQQARAALNAGDAIAAKAALDRAEELQVSISERAVIAGELAILADDLDAARRWLDPSIMSAATRVRGMRALARLERQEGNFAAATQSLQLALAAGGDRADIWTDIGRLRYAAGNHRGAIEAANFAVSLDGADAAALLYKSQLTREAEGLSAALPWLERARDLAPDDLAVMGEHAATLADAGQGTRALTLTREILKLDPKNERAFFIQAIIAARAQKHDLANRLLARAGDTFSDTNAGLLITGLLAQRNGAPRLASEALVELATDRRPSAANLLPEALIADGDPTELVAQFDDDLAATSAVMWNVVLAKELTQDRGAAGVAFDEAANITWGGAVRRKALAEPQRLASAYAAQPDNIDGAIAYAQSLLADRRDTQAATVSDAIARRHPGNFAARLIQGDASLAAGNATGAIEGYRAAAAIRRGSALVRKLALAHLDMGNAGQAKAILANYILEHPLGRDAPTFLGTLLLREGNAVAAARLLEATHPKARRDPLGLARLAWAQLQSGQIAQAEKNARTAYLMQRSSIPAALVLASAIEVDGDDNETVAALRAKRGDMRIQAAMAPLLAL